MKTSKYNHGSICVVGLWHLGSVTASCLASLDLEVMGFDDDTNLTKKLMKGKPPIEEPGLTRLIDDGLKNKKINFSSNPKDLENHLIYWITFDTPVDENDNANIELVISKIEHIFKYIKDESIIIVSSQLPVGSIDRIKTSYQNKYKKNLNICYIPENLRLGKSLEVFLNPDRLIIGFDKPYVRKVLTKILNKITNNLIWISIPAAEMAKHSINAFLATSVVFANEIASLCEKVGADAKQVEKALKSDFRIGEYAYLGPGGPYAGGTLARDVVYLNKIGKDFGTSLPLISNISVSNNHHKEWVLRNINENDKKKFKKLLIMGIIYKEGTNTLRRSYAIELAQNLSSQSESIDLYDPLIDDNNKLNLKKNIFLHNNNKGLKNNYDCIIICRSWSNILDEIINITNNSNKRMTIYDVNRLLTSKADLFISKGYEYKTIGLPNVM
tara:strand:- start:923 stop:2248 length:1326 start_codon:yes stop_codon:yes gene_type:complete